MYGHVWEPPREAFSGSVDKTALSCKCESSPSARTSATPHPRGNPRLTEVSNPFLSSLHFLWLLSPKTLPGSLSR